MFSTIGGRIQTFRGFDTPVDLGASWIHGLDDNPLFGLLSNPKSLHFLEFGQVRPTNAKHTVTKEQSGFLLSKVWQLHFRMVAAAKNTKMNMSIMQFILNDKQWKKDIAEVLKTFKI